MTKITLNLTEQEVRALHAVLSWIGGRPLGPRGLFNDILNAIEDKHADVSWEADDYVKGGHIILVDAWPSNVPKTVKVEVL